MSASLRMTVRRVEVLRAAVSRGTEATVSHSNRSTRERRG